MTTIKEKISVAIKANNFDEIEELILCREYDSDPRMLNYYSGIADYALHEAASSGNLDVVNFLLGKGGNVNCENKFQQSVLQRAIHSRSENKKAVVEFLIDKGAHINYQSRCGASVFMDLVSDRLISIGKEIELIDTLENIQERSLITGRSYLHIVCMRESSDVVPLIKKLIDKGISVNCRDNYDDTPLHLAAQAASVQSLQCLIDNGADITTTNRNGASVLHGLSYGVGKEGFSECLKYLIEHGADINGMDNDNRTLLHQSLLMEEIDCKTIEQLFEYGLKANLPDYRGRNELFYALTNIDFRKLDPDVRTAVLQLLVRCSVDINQQDVSGITPLHLAAKLDSLDLLVELLDLGADCTLPTNSGATPLHWACKHYNMAHVLILTYLRNGKDLNIRDNFGSTALHYAVWYRKLSVAQTLLQAGIDASLTDTFGDTASDLARKLDLPEFNEILTTYESLEPLELQEPTFKHRECDSVTVCPLLKYIVKTDSGLKLDDYMEHLSEHKCSVQKFTSKILRAKNMGLYFDIAENEMIQETFKSVIENLSSRVFQKNPLFKTKLRLAGSVFEGTKVCIPDEFDFLWIFTEFNSMFEPVESPSFPKGFIQLRLKSTDKAESARFADFLDKNNHLDCDLVIRRFYKLVNEVVRDMATDSSFANVICLKELKEIWCSISSLKFEYFGIQRRYSIR